MQTGPLCVLGCYILWGVLPAFWKQLEAVDSFYVVGCRIVWSFVFTGLILLIKKDGFAGVKAAFRVTNEWKKLTLAGLVICINWAVFIWAVINGQMIDASLAYYMNPILAILVGTIVFREKLTRLQWLAVAVTFIGLVITVVRYGQIPWIALIVGGTFAIYGAIKKTVHTDAATSTFIETMMFSPLFLCLILFMEFRGTGAAGVLQGWQWILLPMAGVVTTVPLLLFSAGMHTTSMSLSGILMYINPTLQLLISVWLYHEEFTTTHAILFAFVWTGLALYLISDRLKAKRDR